LQLQPDLPEAHLALGFSYYYGDNNYDAALKEFQSRSADYLTIRSLSRYRRNPTPAGKWQSPLQTWKRRQLESKDTWPLQNLAFNYEMLRDFQSQPDYRPRSRIEPHRFGCGKSIEVGHF